MKPSYHVAISAGVSLGFQAATHSWPATAGCFFSGILIDLDHYLEYYIIRKKIPFDYKDLVDFCWDGRVNKQYLIFHAYEFIFALWLLIYFFNLGLIWTGIALGLTVHVMLDQFTNPIKPLFYFLFFRIIHKFEKKEIMSEKYFQHNNK